jgi:hypothetical protein
MAGFPMDHLAEIEAQRRVVADLHSRLTIERGKLRNMEREQSRRVDAWLNTQTERMLRPNQSSEGSDG